MSQASIQRVVKGDVIVERINGKKRMTPVARVEFNACSSNGVHINRSMCYDFNAVVDIEDHVEELEEFENEFPTDQDLQDAHSNSIEAWADRLVKV